MKLTKTGYRISKNGNPIKSIEADAHKSETFLGGVTKVNGIYYYFNRKQGDTYIYKT